MYNLLTEKLITVTTTILLAYIILILISIKYLNQRGYSIGF